MTLFISIVIMGLLLFISFAVVNISIKAALFANTGRDSHHAFYAADSGIECAIYWDTRFDPSRFDTSNNAGSPINCAGSSMSTNDAISGTTTLTRIGGGGLANPTSVFGFVLNQGSNPVSYCAIVTVTKNLDGSTHIYSRGYNTCDTTNPRRVERGVEVTY